MGGYPLNDTADEEPRAPHSWRGLGYGLALLSICSLACLLLILHYYSMLPADLRGQTAALSQAAREVFESKRIPVRRIRLVSQETQSDEQTVWQRDRYEVELGEGFNLDGTKRILRRELGPLGIIISEGEWKSGEREFLLSVGGREFAVIHMENKEPTPEPPPIQVDTERTPLPDYTQASQRLRDDARAAIESHGIVPEGIQEEPPQVQADAQHVWRLHEMRVIVPRGEGAELEGKIRQVLGGRPEVEIVRRGTTEQVSYRLEVYYMGLKSLVLTVRENGRLDALDFYDEAAGTGEYPALEMTYMELHEEVPAEEQEATEEGQKDEEAYTPEAGPARIAIIVDDGGYGGEVGREILALDTALTLAILPFAPHSKASAQEALERGFEVMLHMPMECKEAKHTYPQSILTSMTEEEVSATVTQALSDVPGASGVNNHTGSLYTTDAEAMRRFFKAIQDQKLFYIDSRTTKDTVAYDVATEEGVRAGKRELFLDNVANPALIRRRTWELVERARKRGGAIGICHFRPATVKALKQVLPELKEYGVELVHVSELLP